MLEIQAEERNVTPLNIISPHMKSPRPCINSSVIPSPKYFSALDQRDQSASALTTVVTRVDLSSPSKGSVTTCSHNAYNGVEVLNILTHKSRDDCEMLNNLPERA